MKPVKRPPGLLCSNCARRAFLGKGSPKPSQFEFQFDQAFEDDLRVFQLKLRDWLGVSRVELRPCLSVCPESGITVERRGKTMVLDQVMIDEIKGQFDPTRQLSFLDSDDENK